MLKLTQPVIITARLLPGLRIGDTFISIEYDGWSADNRQTYRYYIDFSASNDAFHIIESHSKSDIHSGVGGGGLQEGLKTLLSFLSNAAEIYRHNGLEPRGDEGFPPAVCEWAYQNDDEIAALKMELESGQFILEDQQ